MKVTVIIPYNVSRGYLEDNSVVYGNPARVKNLK